MVVTALEAQVAQEKWPILEQTYREAISALDRGIAETFLLQSPREHELWRILTVWDSHEALEEMRRSGETPRGVLIFRAAGAEPTLSIFDVVSHAGLTIGTV